MIVDPEREVPGTMESTWKQPMPMAVGQSMSSVSWMRASRSAGDALAWDPSPSGEGAARCLPRTDGDPSPMDEASSALRSRRVSMRMKRTP